MGCLKLSYYEQERALEVNPIFFTSAVEKKRYAEKNRLSSSTFGFNGMERDDETTVDGNTYDYGFRIYNSQIARFLSVDPLAKEYPWYTPYQFAGNKPIWATDRDGLEEWVYTNGDPAKPGPYSKETQAKLGLTTEASVAYSNGLPYFQSTLVVPNPSTSGVDQFNSTVSEHDASVSNQSAGQENAYNESYANYREQVQNIHPTVAGGKAPFGAGAAEGIFEGAKIGTESVALGFGMNKMFGLIKKSPMSFNSFRTANKGLIKSGDGLSYMGNASKLYNQSYLSNIKQYNTNVNIANEASEAALNTLGWIHLLLDDLDEYNNYTQEQPASQDMPTQQDNTRVVESQ